MKVSRTGLYTYPDILIGCGEQRFADEHKDTLLNPVVIIEVLSPSTESDDRGEKFAHYRTLDSLMEYLPVAHDEPRIELYARQPDGNWLLHEASTSAVHQGPMLGGLSARKSRGPRVV